MKIISILSIFIFFSIFIFGACSNSSGPVLNYQLLLKQYHLGEYLQVENSHSMISVNRSEERSGLVRIHLPENELTVLDGSAKEARDILISGGKIAYRVDQE